MQTTIIGILNITPDSFSDGGCYNERQQAVARAVKLVEEGADIIDIGAESTRPGAIALTPEAEWQRLEAVLPDIIHAVHTQGAEVSIDSYHPETVAKALAMGVDIINDVSGGENAAMRAVLAASQATYIVMHNCGIPADKHILPEGKDVVAEVYGWAEQKLAQLEQEGIARRRVILDPGIGFGKSARQSLELLRNLEEFNALNVRLCIGHSRKSFLAGFSLKPPADRDIETLTVSLLLAQHGVAYVRVHDVASHQRAFAVLGGLTVKR